MILVFGGTTEGRKAVKALEESGSIYYYSTRGDIQEVELAHGVRLSGTMETSDIAAFCQEHDIRLIVDAAHPFAVRLHRNLLSAASAAHVPVIRFERQYPPHSDDITWCRDYDDAIRQLEEQGVDRLLALTGVNTIGALRPYWEKRRCWFRILDRDVSRQLARREQFPEDRLVYYEHDDTSTLLAQLRPQAILTKESGVSGGFCEKVEAARRAGVSVFAVERPVYPPRHSVPLDVHIEVVNGEYGLRRTVERLLPAFYPLHSGLTTGTCATAAAVAAATRLLRSESPAEVPVVLPDGETIPVPVTYGDGYASVWKESGDDPDVTNGLEIRVAVERKEGLRESEILGGPGVGTITLPGFDYPPGSPAINKAPRQMIRENLRPFGVPLSVTVSVPEGAEIARRTFNPRLGIVDGISIIGVSGIVKPFSEDAFIESIRKCMTIAKASGSDRVVINSGAKSERFVKARYPALPSQAFVEYGNYIGETLRIADELRIPQVTLGVMLGKAVKLAAGQLDTHSKRGVMDKDLIARMLDEAGCPMDVSGITLARELWQLLPPESVRRFARVVIAHCAAHCRPLLPDGSLTILLIDEEGQIYE